MVRKYSILLIVRAFDLIHEPRILGAHAVSRTIRQVMIERARILCRTMVRVSYDLVSLLWSMMRSRAQLAAENLFLRKQLPLYLERQSKLRRADDATRITLVALSRFLDWRRLLTVVKPETLIRWHRKGFRLFWRWKSGARGRPPIPADLQQLIAMMAAANRTWGEERIAAELLVKLGIRISPRTVRRYMPSRPPRAKPGTQAWSTFVRNHARSVLASDFFVVVTATFRVIYPFVVLEVGTRRILHWNVTAHPTAEWTAQQFRMIVPGNYTHRFVIHDRDTIYSEGVDRSLEAMGLTVLRTPARAPRANAFCERWVGTIRRECLDFVIPLHERHLRAVVREWVTDYNRGRPHASLGPGIPECPQADPRRCLKRPSASDWPLRRRTDNPWWPPSRISPRAARVKSSVQEYLRTTSLMRPPHRVQSVLTAAGPRNQNS